MRNRDDLVATLLKIARRYPPDLIDIQVRDVPRIAFNIGLGLARLAPKAPSELEICDLGGGVGLFSVGCAAYGFKRTVLVDDFNDAGNSGVAASILDLHRSYGVDVISRDVIAEGIQDLAGRFDIISTFDSMEHWHHSPKRLLREIVEKLKPGGVFVLAVPNCVNLRKRLTVPFGVGKWSRMQDWYETERFRGHVREPDVGDVMYIARDMGLTDVVIHGRNWLGHGARSVVVRVVARILDQPLRLSPSLCSDIYLVGIKP